MELQKRNKLIIDNIRLVEIQAKKKKRKAPSLEYDDLISAGYPGLIEAAERYNEEKGSFEPYASKRIAGAMNNYIHEFQHWGKWQPKDVKVSSLEDHGEIAYDKQDRFEEIISVLNPSEQQILRWNFVEGLTYKQIGEKLGVSESRMSQRMKKLLYNLTNFLI